VAVKCFCLGGAAAVTTFIYNFKLLLDKCAYRYHRCNEESMSNDLMTSSMEDDLQLLESPNFDSSVNLCKDNEDNNSGDIYLLLQPQNNWMDS